MFQLLNRAEQARYVSPAVPINTGLLLGPSLSQLFKVEISYRSLSSTPNFVLVW